LAWFGGLWLSVETVSRVPQLQKLAFGWKLLAIIGTGFVYKTLFTAYNAWTYGPVVSAYLRKYSNFAKSDQFEITDRKREYFYIDTSSYMNYELADLPHSHAAHGPQPVS
jgi:hypothetical protein